MAPLVLAACASLALSSAALGAQDPADDPLGDELELVDLALENAVTDELPDLRARKVEILQRALEEAEGVQRGLFLGELASTSGSREAFDLAIESLEEVIFEQGEGTPAALRAYVAVGEVYMGAGRVEDAVHYYQSVADAALQIHPPTPLRLWPSRIAKHVALLELALPGLLEALVRLGDVEIACRYALHFTSTLREWGVEPTPRGYEALLSAARTLFAAGGFVGGDPSRGECRWCASESELQTWRFRRERDDAVSFALRLAHRVELQSPRTVDRLRARQLVAEIVDHPGVAVTPDALLDVAENESIHGRHEEAREWVKRALRSLESREQRERVEHGARAMYLLGTGYRHGGRLLEAAVACRDGVAVWLGDPGYDFRNSGGYYEIALQLVRRFPEDPFFAKMLDEAITYDTWWEDPPGKHRRR